MKYFKKTSLFCMFRNYKTPVFIIFFILFSFLIFSCTSFQVTSRGFSEKNLKFTPKDTFYLESIKVVCFNFFDDEQVTYILNQKLAFELEAAENIRLVKNKGEAQYIIEPELIVKSYQQVYRDKNYYLFQIRIYREKELVLQYNYEYNGNHSIFDAGVQRVLLKRFLQDFKKTG